MPMSIASTSTRLIFETNVLPANRPENMSGFQRHTPNNLAVARVVSAMRRRLKGAG